MPRSKMQGGGTVSKGSARTPRDMARLATRFAPRRLYDTAREMELDRDREARRYRTGMYKKAGKKAGDVLPIEKDMPSEAVQTMRRQQRELDARMADMPGMRSGGKVRGCGRAERGVRAARIIKMKGS